jgi:signal transduction histidine kinase
MWDVIGGVGLCLVPILIVAVLAERARRRRAEGELRRLAGRLIEAQEAERRRVARELHDDLSQGLALLSIDLDLLARRPPASPAGVVEQARDLSTRLRELSSAVHDLSHQLHPSKLEQIGLVAAVRGLCRELSQHHDLNVTFDHHDVPTAIPVGTALCLYRIAQEGLRNVVRHGRTDRASVELTGTPTGLRLVVSDDGAGFDVAAVLRNGGLGLVSMRERLHLAGGELTIDARVGGGTRIEARVPTPVPHPAADRPIRPVRPPPEYDSRALDGIEAVLPTAS